MCAPQLQASYNTGIVRNEEEKGGSGIVRKKREKTGNAVHGTRTEVRRSFKELQAILGTSQKYPGCNVGFYVNLSTGSGKFSGGGEQVDVQ